MVLKECVTDPNTNADDARLATLATKFEESVYQHAASKVRVSYIYIYTFSHTQLIQCLYRMRILQI